MGDKGARGFDPRRLTALRAQRGLTGKELAELVGISPEELSRYERGHSAPQIERLNAIAAVLRARPAEFITPGSGLAAMRAAAGLVQEQVVEQAGPDWTISRYRHLELGHVRRLRHDDAQTLARIFGVSAEQIRAAHEQTLATAQHSDP